MRVFCDVAGLTPINDVKSGSDTGKLFLFFGP